MATHKVDDYYVISSHHVWRPGAYDSERTARYAFRFPDETLLRLQDRKNEQSGGAGGIITFDDLQGEKFQQAELTSDD